MIDLRKVTNTLEDRRKEIEREFKEMNASSVDFEQLLADAEKMTKKEFIEKTKSQATAIPTEFKTPYKRSINSFAERDEAIAWSSR